MDTKEICALTVALSVAALAAGGFFTGVPPAAEPNIPKQAA